MEQMMQQMTGDMKPPKSVRPVATEDKQRKGRNHLPKRQRFIE